MAQSWPWDSQIAVKKKKKKKKSSPGRTTSESYKQSRDDQPSCSLAKMPKDTLATF